MTQPLIRTAVAVAVIAPLVFVGAAPPATAVKSYTAGCTDYTDNPYNAVRLNATVYVVNGSSKYLVSEPRSNNPNGWTVRVFINGSATHAYTNSNVVRMVGIAVRKSGRAESLDCLAYIGS